MRSSFVFSILFLATTILLAQDTNPLKGSKWEPFSQVSGAWFLDKEKNLNEISDSKDDLGRPFFALIKGPKPDTTLFSASFKVFDGLGEVIVAPAWKDANNWIGAEWVDSAGVVRIIQVLDGTEKVLSETKVSGKKPPLKIGCAISGQGIKMYIDDEMVTESAALFQQTGGYALGGRDRQIAFTDYSIVPVAPWKAGSTLLCPVVVSKGVCRTVFQRMEKDAGMVFKIKNMTHEKLSGLNVKFSPANILSDERERKVNEIGPEGEVEVRLTVPTDKLRADDYDIFCVVDVPPYKSANEKFKFRIVNRPNPERFPVLMWGGIPQIGKSAKLAELGFNRVMCVELDLKFIYENPDTSKPLASSTLGIIDDAMANGLEVGLNFSPGYFLVKYPENQRVKRDGRANSGDICPHLPANREFSKRAARALMQAYGGIPAFTFANINTEIRDHSAPCFHQIDKDLYKKASGEDIPKIVEAKNVNYKKVPDFPQNRVVDDNHPILKYYTWYWKHGDGWVDINDLIHAEMKADRNGKFFTWFDPALRLAPVYGAGGKLDMIGQWTYTYPDPIRVGMTADELINMAGGYDRKQRVFQMIQMIWYKSQTAPTAKKKESPDDTSDPFLADHIPDTMFPTPSPAHIKEAFWADMSRPVDMIGFHGLGCLVPGESGGYIYTHPDTAPTLAKLNNEITKPYGPMFRKLPDRKTDVAFLESFTTHVFTGKGAYGWASGPVGAWWHACAYAGLQMDIIFEETIKEKGLDPYKVLVLPECEVLSKSAFDKIVAFQKRGGIIIADQNLVPDIKPDILIPTMKAVTSDGKQYKADNLATAEEIRKHLRPKYKPFAESENKEVILHARQYNDDQYIFAINDMRAFGDYVGSYGMVMENGIQAKSTIQVMRTGVSVIDVLEGKEVPSQTEGQYTKFSTSLEPAGGKIFLVTKNKAAGITLGAPENGERGKRVNFEIAVNGLDGKPMPSLVPMKVNIMDPAFRPAEAAGYYAAVDGKLSIPLDIAENDRIGVWEISVSELVTGLKTEAYFTVK